MGWGGEVYTYPPKARIAESQHVTLLYALVTLRFLNRLTNHSDDESDSDTESATDSDTDTDSDSDSGVSETEADDYARVVRVLAEDLADYQPPHKRVRFTIGTGMIPNSESNSCFRSIRVPSTPTTAN